MPRRPRAPAAPLPGYEPGFFTALIREHNWPPMWQPSTRTDEPAAAPMRSIKCSQQKDTRAAKGIGWADGTINLPRTPTHMRPAWLVRRPSR